MIASFTAYASLRIVRCSSKACWIRLLGRVGRCASSQSTSNTCNNATRDEPARTPVRPHSVSAAGKINLILLPFQKWSQSELPGLFVQSDSTASVLLDRFQSPSSGEQKRQDNPILSKGQNMPKLYTGAKMVLKSKKCYLGGGEPQNELLLEKLRSKCSWLDTYLLNENKQMIKLIWIKFDSCCSNNSMDVLDHSRWLSRLEKEKVGES